MFKCATCRNFSRCKLPEKCTETSEICDCYESDESEEFDEEIMEHMSIYIN